MYERRRRRPEVFPSSANVCTSVWGSGCITYLLRSSQSSASAKQHFGVNDRYVDLFGAVQRWLSVGVRDALEQSAVRMVNASK